MAANYKRLMACNLCRINQDRVSCVGCENNVIDTANVPNVFETLSQKTDRYMARKYGWKTVTLKPFKP